MSDCEQCSALQRQNDLLANDRDGYVQSLTDENNKLRVEVERLSAFAKRAAMDVLLCEDGNILLHEENEKLRAALRPLACTCEARHQADCSRREVDCPFWNARAALEGK